MIDVGWREVAVSLMPTVLALGMLYRIQLFKSSAIAVVRTIFQLAILSAVLKYVFQLETPWVLVAVFIFMILVAMQTVVGRLSHSFKGLRMSVLLGLLGVMLTINLFALLVVFEVTPWFKSSFAIPVIGILIGNSLTGVTLALDRFFETLISQESSIDFFASHGAQSSAMIRPALVSSVKAGTIPIINSMMVVGLISIPGVMTGQLLAGQEPDQAGLYQLIILLLIYSATVLSIFSTLYFVGKNLIDPKTGYIIFNKLKKATHV